MDGAERLLDALRAMGRREAAIGRPLGYGTLASELLDIGEEAMRRKAIRRKARG